MNIKNIFKRKGGKHLGIIESRIPYPYRAARLQIELTLFPWWKPKFKHFHLTEKAKAAGETQWFAHWLWFQISFSRWL